MDIQNKQVVTKYLLAEKAEKNGDKPYIFFEDRVVTYRDLDTRANQVGNGAASLGVKKGDRVLIMLNTCPEYIFAWMGLTTIGAMEVPVNTAYKGNMLVHIVNDSGAECMIIDAEFLERLQAVEGEILKLKKVLVFSESPLRRADLPRWKFETLLFEDLFSAPADLPDVAVSYHDLIAIMYTSGTTGPSKGVKIPYLLAYQYTHAQLESEVVVPGRNHYCCLPLFHLAGQWYDCYAAFLGDTAVALSRKFSVRRFWEEVRRYRCGSGFMIGAMANFIVNQPPQPNDADNPLERMIINPLPPDPEEFKRRFGLKLSTSYGATESGIPLYEKDPKDAKTCGRVREGFELRIVNGFDEEVPIGHTGELVLRHKDPWAIMAGYYNHPQKTEESWRNLWFHTGDLFYRNEGGNYFFVDRMKDAIRRRGENISSYEVEREINSHPAVLDSAVIAVKSEYAEDEVKAVIVLHEGEQLRCEDLIRYLEPRMPRFMIPRYIEYKPFLPKTPTEKVKKDILRGEGITDAVWDREKHDVNPKDSASCQ
jgi:carnitine-CoA ligase